MAQNIVRLDEGEEEENEVTQEAHSGMGGGGQEDEETRDRRWEEKRKQLGRGEERKGDARLEGRDNF